MKQRRRAIKRPRTLRGGSWNNNTDNLRCSARNNNDPRNEWNNNGFRVLRAQ
jgi:formylglycine-generating enzyme required for sulfatase activity